MLDDDNNEVAEFKRNITPEYVDILPLYLIDLLNVSFKEIEGKCNFEQGIRDFINWMYLYSDDFYIYAWSNNDFDRAPR